ncbi:RNA-directed DNA polymerase [Kribbella sp. NBC_01484]|uniref:RNA-directed DNA polymerase n=1 Tax=Kribbella sp. NBC_01484 TaxID=2903579 RepID=UPI002E32F8C3|nr:RNA-directed DNA polymerase [Kribbella sp. NBC_01484]
MAGRNAARVFESVTAPRNLRRVYRDHVESSSARGRDGIDGPALRKDIRAICSSLSRSLRSGSFRFTQYRLLLISKGPGKPPREIAVPTARDRLVLRALADLIIEIYPDTRGEIPQAKVQNVRNCLDSGQFDTYIRIDIENFYPSIRHSDVFKALSGKIRKKALGQVLRDALETPTVPDGSPKRPASGRNRRGVPQGLAISNPLAELILTDVDKFFDTNNDVAYVRFVDDILILCDGAASESIEADCIDRLKRLGLDAHRSLPKGGKSSRGAVADGFDYLGYKFHPGLTTVRQSSVARIESSLARAFTAYKKHCQEHPGEEHLAFQRCLWQVNLTISGCIYKTAARGWLQYYRQMDDLTLLNKLDATVVRFTKRFGLARQFTPKRFLRAYWEIRHPRSGSRYVPNFDTYRIDERRSALLDLGVGRVSAMSDKQVNAAFFSIVNKAVSRLEHDIGLTS